MASWKSYKRHPLSAEYKDITGAAWDRFVDNVKRNRIVRGRRITLHEGQVLDGWQLYRACIEADIEPQFAKLEGIAAEDFVEVVNDHRRHESQEQALKRILKRRERVADARANGESLRAIAAKEGITESTVRNDLSETSTAQGCAVEPKTGQITGKDGRAYEKPATVFCSRCARVGPVKNCEACKEARRIAKGGKPDREPGDDKPAKKKSGKQLYDWAGFESVAGKFYRAPDAIVKAYPHEKQSDEAKKIGKLLDEVAETFKAWKKRLTGAKR